MQDAEADAEAVARVRGGEPEAFRVLMERHGRAVHRLAFRMTGNEQDARRRGAGDVPARLPQPGHFEARSQFGSWLYRIAANCAYDALRARARRERTCRRQTRRPRTCRGRAAPAIPAPSAWLAGGGGAAPGAGRAWRA